MFNLNKFIGEHVTHRAESMFAADLVYQGGAAL